MATQLLQIKRQYRDLDLNFNIHPVRKDVTKHVSEMAVINSIKNLILLNHYEKPFRPDIGSNVRKLLFENMDAVTAMAIEREIRQVIKNYEPRASVLSITVSPDFDNNGFGVTLEFSVNNVSDPISISFLLERTR